MEEADERGIEPGSVHMEASKLLEAANRLLDVMETLKKIIVSRVVYFETQPGIFRKTLVRRCLEVCIEVDGFSFRGCLSEVCRKVHKHIEKLASEHNKLKDSTMLYGKLSTQ